MNMNELFFLQFAIRFFYTPISIKVAPMNRVSLPAVHYGKPFCSGKFSLVHVL